MENLIIDDLMKIAQLETLMCGSDEDIAAMKTAMEDMNKYYGKKNSLKMSDIIIPGMITVQKHKDSDPSDFVLSYVTDTIKGARVEDCLSGNTFQEYFNKFADSQYEGTTVYFDDDNHLVTFNISVIQYHHVNPEYTKNVIIEVRMIIDSKEYQKVKNFINQN